MFNQFNLCLKSRFLHKINGIQSKKEVFFWGNNISNGEDYKYIPATSYESGKGTEISPDIFSHTVQIVNIIFVGHPNSNEFVLIDAGMPYSAKKIISVMENVLALIADQKQLF